MTYHTKDNTCSICDTLKCTRWYYGSVCLACYTRLKRKNSDYFNSYATVKSKKILKCTICSNEFSAINGSAKTCSATCRSRAHSLRHRNKPQTKSCGHCGTKFSFTEGSRNKKTYCSNSCKNKARYIRESNDPNERLKKSIRCRLLNVINKTSLPQNLSDLLGCSIDELRAHLESQFQEGMTWENRGYSGWHIDHIKPLASFDLTDPDELKKACHYTNLQPLWARDNLRKSNKY